MSETSFPSGVVPPNTSADPSGRSGATEPNARLVNLPNEVRAEVQTRKASLRIRGEVVKNNDDGSIRVRTERGDIDVKVREGQRAPQRGERVEIQIQPNKTPDRPPETATVRTLPSTQSVDQPPPRASNTPVNVEVRPDSARPQTVQTRDILPPELRHGQNTAQKAQSLPAEGSVVRLQPLPIRSVAALPAQPLLDIVTSTITQPAIFQAQVAAQNVINETAQQIVTPRPASPPIATQQVVAFQTPQLAETLPPVLQSAVPVLSNPQELPALVQTPPIITGDALPLQPRQALQVAAQFNQGVLVTTPRPAPLATLAETVSTQQQSPLQTIPAQVALKAQPLDVVIQQVSPSVPVVSAPAEASATPLIQPTPVGIGQTVSIAAESQPTPPLILQNQSAGSTTGIVTAVTQDSLPVLSVFFPQYGTEQFFTLQFPSDAITVGTQIQVTPQTSLAPATQSLASLPQIVPLPLYMSPQPWPAMDDVLQTLARAVPQTAQAFVNISPSPTNPAQLGPAIMFFVAALKGGDLNSWLGNKAVDILRGQKGGQSLSRLMGEAPTLTRVAAEPMPQDWRALNLPLYWDGDMHKIGLYYRHEHEGDDDTAKGLKSTRFVFDLALERMGKVQLDGLFRPQGGSADTGRLDLVVRTEEVFAQATQAEMRRLYAKGLRHTQVTGELSFQNQRESWVTIQVDEENRLGVSA